MDKAVELTGLSQPELVSFVETLGEPAYRGRQLFAALQHRRLRSFDEITDLPKDLRTRLSEMARASNAQSRIAVRVRRRHAPLPDENPRRSAGRNSFHSRRTTRHDLFFIAIRLPVAVHLLPDGPTRFVAFTNCRRDRRTDPDRAERCLRNRRQTSTRNEPGRDGSGRAVAQSRSAY